MFHLMLFRRFSTFLFLHLQVVATLLCPQVCFATGVSGQSYDCLTPPQSADMVTPSGISAVALNTYSGLPFWIGGLESISSIPSSYVNITKTHYLGQRHCPYNNNNRRRHSHFMHDLAYCPYRFVENTDVNRFPNTLLETECLCKHPEDNSFFCQDVVRYVKVQRRTGCDNGNAVYKDIWESIRIACIAVRKPHSKALNQFSIKMDM